MGPDISTVGVKVYEKKMDFRNGIGAIEQMDVTEEDKKKIYEDNARKLMRSPIYL